MASSGTVTVRETERKFEAGPEFVLPAPGELIAGAAAVGDEQVLVATYFDTGDLRLIGAGVTLRRREGGSDAGWHLKLPAGVDTRDEVRLPLGRSVRKPPSALSGLVRVHTRGRPLGPVADLRTHRRRLVLTDPDGRELAEVVDDEVRASTMGEETTTVSWREIEVELLAGGDIDVLDQVEEVLRKAGARRSKASSKLDRLLGEREQVPREPELGKRSSAGAAVLGYLWKYAGELRRHDPLVRQDAPDAVHQMRVSARRMRSTLQAFGKILDKDQTRSLIEDLKWIGNELAAARDSEVMAEHLDAVVGELPPTLVLGPVQATVTREFSRREQDARKAALSALDSDRYLQLQSRIDEFFAAPPLTARAARPAQKELPAAISRSWRRLKGRMAVAEAAGGEDRDVALHESRKAAKRLRYATEAAEPALGKPAKRLREKLKAVQELLGEHQDTAVVRPELRALAIAAHGEGLNTFTFGILYRAEQARAEAAEERLPAAWKALTAAKTTGWLR